jgi:hypothetical protein
LCRTLKYKTRNLQKKYDTYKGNNKKQLLCNEYPHLFTHSIFKEICKLPILYYRNNSYKKKQKQMEMYNQFHNKMHKEKIDYLNFVYRNIVRLVYITNKGTKYSPVRLHRE